MGRLQWDKTDERTYETGVENGTFYPQKTDGTYNKGVAWNGLTGVTESPSGAEPTPIYADNIKYLTLMSVEEIGATIEAYTFSEEFGVCDGTAELATSVLVGQQPRRAFGMVYKTKLGNYTEGETYGYKIHILYNALAAPSEKSYTTINDSPEAITFSWEVTTTPISVPGFKPTALITIDSTKVDSDKLAELEDILFGSDTTPETEPRLPMPDEIAAIFAAA